MRKPVIDRNPLKPLGALGEITLHIIGQFGDWKTERSVEGSGVWDVEVTKDVEQFSLFVGSTLKDEVRVDVVWQGKPFRTFTVPRRRWRHNWGFVAQQTVLTDPAFKVVKWEEVRLHCYYSLGQEEPVVLSMKLKPI